MGTFWMMLSKSWLVQSHILRKVPHTFIVIKTCHWTWTSHSRDMTRFTLFLLLCLSLSLFTSKARPSDGSNNRGQNNGFQSNQGGEGAPPPPGQLNGGDSTECPQGYVWDEWRGGCVRYFG